MIPEGPKIKLHNNLVLGGQLFEAASQTFKKTAVELKITYLKA